MSGSDLFPFTPERLAALTAWSREQTGTTLLAPIGTPVVVDDSGYGWIPAPDGGPELVGSYIHAGIRLGWSPVAELDGLRRLIADLQSIERQLGGAHV